MQALPARITARALSNLRPSLAAAVLHGVDRNRGSALLAMLDTTMAARVLRQVTEERRIALLAQLRTAKGMALRLILAVPDNSAGAWVDADCITLTTKVTAGAARQRVTAASGTAERIVVLDDDQRPGQLGGSARPAARRGRYADHADRRAHTRRTHGRNAAVGRGAASGVEQVARCCRSPRASVRSSACCITNGCSRCTNRMWPVAAPPWLRPRALLPMDTGRESPPC